MPGTQRQPNSFAALLRRHRGAAGLSQEALAERAGISRRAIADLERGARRFPYGETVRRLADALDLAPGERAALLAASHRPEAALTPVSYTSLPLAASSLVGREHELAELQSMLPSARLLTLSGTAGIGKTRLALCLAHLAQSDFSDGAVFVELASIVEPGHIAPAVARALGLREDSATPFADTLRQHLASRHLLLVLDNCEHLLGACARLTDALLRTCPRVQVLATSREALRVAGETVWPVPALRPLEASQLFVERARSALATWQPPDADGPLVAEVCQRLDGIPLAIELAAARVPALGLAQVAARLSDPLRSLRGGSRADAPRHQTLRAAIDWSYALLSAPEQQLLARLAVFADGWDMPAAMAVCGAGLADPDDVLDGLTNLVDKSLVVAEPRGSQMRYRLLEMIRHYAAERLAALGQSADVQRGHAAYYRSLAESGAVARRGILYPARMDVLHQEQANLRAALGALLALGAFADGLALCLALSGFWLFHGSLAEGEDWLWRYLAHAEHLPWDLRARALLALGRLAEYRSGYGQARDYFERSLVLAREQGGASACARALFAQGDIALHQGDHARASRLFADGLAIEREASLLPEVAEVLVGLAQIEAADGQPDQSRQHLHEALRLQRQLGHDWGIAMVLNELAQRTRTDGDLEQAQVLEQEALARWQASGSRMGERAALMNLAVIHLERGDKTDAAACCLAALALCRELADASASTLRCLEVAAAALAETGAAALAVRLESAATAQREVLGAPVPPAEQPERQHTLAVAASTLTTHAYEQAWLAGARLSTSQSVDLAEDGLLQQQRTMHPRPV